ncbi:MAG: hypothetical protein LBH05_02890 [Deferribacteraceae bacterium]|nr:hypothetical protein [Deferribacteraceae bacterium]
MYKKILFCSIFLFLSGCAVHTIQEQLLTFHADVEDVKVTIDNRSCYTPCQITVAETGSKFMVTGEKEGYPTVSEWLLTRRVRKEKKSFWFGGGTQKVDSVSGDAARILLALITTSSTTTTVYELSSDKFYEYSPSCYYFNMEGGNKSGIRFKETIPLFFALENIYVLRQEAAYGGGEGVDALAIMLQTDEKSVIRLIKRYEDNMLLARKIEDIQRDNKKNEKLISMKKAATQGYVKAQAQLGEMYINGDGVSKSIVTGCAWIYLSGDPELSAACDSELTLTQKFEVFQLKNKLEKRIEK